MIPKRFKSSIKQSSTWIYQNVTNSYAKIEDILTRVAIQIIGKHRKKKQPLMTNEILDVCDTRRKKKPLSEEKAILKDGPNTVMNSVTTQSTRALVYYKLAIPIKMKEMNYK